ncbi:MAG: SGNH/GDSL hydrolase family protein [Spirulinaceae cyanobacterium RM2_2_10]|nr:SGNH/GDSL hydrolase family protein [Spirulinaceae cyanobacterium SM2_1_0]NJO18979.1 SGNH/GDSL hydrolase family protein [Spirulinaceae cyanobacterium RM2_2_10]
MFKSHRSPYISGIYSRRRRRFAFPWKTTLALLGGLIILELGTRLALNFTGQATPINDASNEPAVAYKLQFFNPRGRALSGLAREGQLRLQQRALLSYQLVSEQSSPFWTINAQGFRDTEPVPVDKPEGEIRIFILGGSAAFGQWLPSDDATMAANLERRLQERLEQQVRSPEKYRPNVLPATGAPRTQALALPAKLRDANYRVINAAVPGYVAPNHLAQLATNILPYQPDVIVLLSGYEDLLLPGEREAASIPQLDQFLNQPLYHFWAYLSEPIARFIRNTALFRATQFWLLRPQPRPAETSLPLSASTQPLDDRLPRTERQLEQRLVRYDAAVKQMARLSAGANVPLIVALQPEISGISPEKLQDNEAEIVSQLGSDYLQRAQAGFARLGETNDRLGEAFPGNVKILNYYDLYDQYSAEAFIDAVHLNAPANQALAERFYNAIAELPQLQVQSQEVIRP